MKLSIITINYNNALGLEKTIQSVIEQSYTNYEYIIIDGGSTDGSVEVIQKYADKIKYWVSEPDKGIYNAMNKGIRQAKGEYLNFMNSGDSFFDNNVLSDIFANHTSTEGIIRGHQINDYKTYSTEMDNFGNRNFSMYELLFHGLKHQATFIKKDSFNKYGYYNENSILSADLEHFVKMLLASEETKYINRKVVLFDRTGISSSPKYKSILISEKNYIIEEYFSPSVQKMIRDLYAIETKIDTFEDNIANFISKHKLPRFTFRVICKIYRVCKLDNK